MHADRPGQSNAALRCVDLRTASGDADGSQRCATPATYHSADALDPQRKTAMRVAVFGTKEHEHEIFDVANAAGRHELHFHDAQLTTKTTGLASGMDAVCIFVNDHGDAEVLERLAGHGVRVVALRCAGYDNVDLEAADRLGMTVVRVPAYLPESIAEHATALLLAVNRKIHRAYNRTRDGDFSLTGMMGFTLHSKRAAIVGTGAIGTAFARIMLGFGCEVVGYNPHRHEEFEALEATYGSMDEIGKDADIISLRCPLTPETQHLLNADVIDRLTQGAIVINTARGGIIDTEALIEACAAANSAAPGLTSTSTRSHCSFATTRTRSSRTRSSSGSSQCRMSSSPATRGS